MATLILAAGMPRSGSTWLYNALRLLLRRRYPVASDLACGWVHDLERLPDAHCRLVKVHDYDHALALQANFVAYSCRDLRDVMASLVRKFDQEPSLASADHLVAQYSLWKARADHCMRYETMLADPERELLRIATALGVDGVNSKALCDALNGLSYDTPGPRNDAYNELTLMHRGHITDGRIGSWTCGLPVALERELVVRHADFFAAEGYVTKFEPHGHSLPRA